MSGANSEYNRGLRQQAKKQGLTRYHGQGCLRCGGTERYASNGGCVECKRLNERLKHHAGERKSYYQDYYVKNRGKLSKKDEHILDASGQWLTEEVNERFIAALVREGKSS